ncbi:phosphoribosylanthranilate isomerase [Longimicrobium terrae]|uniref:N-(5'-phosphoribosyl)anthranilate isomerase n=1 Tax=Longimicrobium terrae TaxID=1639882 RepID=A0A841H5H2_9BACT|nr:phosphoribosylanthranilate isomerase [Longimicrobium terrae]MBB4638974.1 phosphoribosylanthranilate isomerase [Longimicrobium terrae]MBB6073213.1 phosphoribosylanthranilate isomerase [Longimicrobium terrae]NNC32335.1 phosphoribosylanthranilate isomerase [Longimicrobium terrae]
MTWPPAVKVCGLMRPEDALAAAEAGADYLGVILAPGGKRTVTAERANVILGGLRPRRVGVFVDADEAELRAAGQAAGLHVLQLHGDEPPALADRMRAAGYEVWKAVRVREAGDVLAAAERYAGSADALLLDGYSAAAHGGTGTVFPWEAVAAIRGGLPAGLRIIAAGGLRPDNVATAARLLRPDAVDVSSGVEREPGLKDAGAVRAFVQAVHSLSP